MKKTFTLLLTFSFCLIGFSQTVPPIKQELNKAQKRDNTKILGDEAFSSLINNQPITAASAAWPGEAIIGFTSYDLQSNCGIQDRIILNSEQGLTANGDASVSAVWTMSNDASAGTSYPDRGTGYNWYDPSDAVSGSQVIGWGSFPSTRIESERCGWPSLLVIENTENIIAHNTQSANMVLNTRNTIGYGTWNESVITSDYIVWNRSCVGGANGKTIHMIAVMAPTGLGGTVYQGLDGALVYWRSLDGGLTWDIQNYIDPSTDATTTTGYGGDSYAIAARGDTIAWVYFGDMSDTFIMQSFDNGSTWNKTLIIDFPIDMWEIDMGSDVDGDGIFDTIQSSDNYGAIALDNNGNPHVFFGLMDYLDDDLTDAGFSWFPGVNGLAYWNNSMVVPDSSSSDYPNYTVDGNELNSLEFMLTPTYSYNWDTVSMIYNTTVNPSMEIIFYNDPGNPSNPTDTLSAWSTSEVTDSLGNITVNVLGPDSSITLSYTTMWNFFNVGTPVVIAGAPDIDGDGVIDAWTDGTNNGIALYYSSLSSMPHTTIDTDGTIYVTYSAHMEYYEGPSGDPTNTIPTQNYRHVFIIKSDDGGLTWSDPVDLTEHIYDQECVFASISKTSDNRLHITYQRDFYPGLAIRGDMDVVELNEIVYMNPLKSDFTFSEIGIQEENKTTVFQNYPNPANTTTSFLVNTGQSTKAVILISNALGQVVSTQHKSLNKGNNKVTINVSNLETGIYFYTTTFNGNSVTKRMIVN